MEWGEELLTAVRRELWEETNLELIDVERLVGVYSAPSRDPRFHSISVAIAVVVKGEMQVQDTIELSEVQAFPFKALPEERLAHDHAQQLQDYLNGQTVVR